MKNFTVTFLVSVLIFGIIAFLVVTFALGALTSDPGVEPGVTTDVNDPPSGPTLSEIQLSGGTDFTALLVGVDYQPEVFSDYVVGSGQKIGFPSEANEFFSVNNQRTPSADTIIVFRVDPENGRMIMSSIPTDASVILNGKSVCLGDVLYLGGIDTLCETVSALCGLPIDYYATVDFAGVAAIVDQIGGVEFNVPQDMEYEDAAEGLKIELSGGMQVLDGEKSLMLLRYRSYADGSSFRLRVGLEFLRALLSKAVQSVSLEDAPQVYSIMKTSVKTNFTTADFMENVKMFSLYNDFQKIVVNYPGTVSQKDGVRVFEPNISAALELFSAYKFAG